MTEVDYDAMLAQIKANVVTPQIAEISVLKNPEQRARKIAELVIRSKHEEINGSAVTFVHNDETHTTRYFDIEPLLTGVWGLVTLSILPLGFVEQTVIIEAFYPKTAQFTAKAFLAHFQETKVAPRSENDPLVERMDKTYAGVAMIVSMLKDMGHRVQHLDKVNVSAKEMDTLAAEQKKREQYKQAKERAEQAEKHRDALAK